MKEIDTLRDKIDVIDESLVKLYVERMNVCREIGELKAKEGIVIQDSTREQSIVDRLSAIEPNMAKYIERLYDTIFATSKDYQKK